MVGLRAAARRDPDQRFSRCPGIPADQCVRAGDHRDIRSSGFLSGNFAADEQLFTATQPQAQQRRAVKIYWIPLHVGHMPELVVQATLLSGHAITRAYQHQIAAGGGHVFYPSVVPIPVPGTWKLVATAGLKQGVFHRDLPRGCTLSNPDTRFFGVALTRALTCRCPFGVADIAAGLGSAAGWVADCPG